jgi:hypothetical protein
LKCMPQTTDVPTNAKRLSYGSVKGDIRAT